jgi:SAM-dependent methyltransferase
MATSSFARPSGVFGRTAGAVMARLNADMEEAAADLVVEACAASSPPGRDGIADVLAIGFGPGVGVAALAARPELRVHGIDPSDAMLAAGKARNRDAIAAGRVELRFGTAEAIPWGPAKFDAAVSVNNVQLWSTVEDGAAEVRRVLRPGGTLVVSVHGWAWKRGLHSLVGIIDAGGFDVTRQWEDEVRSGPALHLVASRTPGVA